MTSFKTLFATSVLSMALASTPLFAGEELDEFIYNDEPDVTLYTGINESDARSNGVDFAALEIRESGGVDQQVYGDEPDHVAGHGPDGGPSDLDISGWLH